MMPDYDLDKIKFATDKPTFERGIDLYESGKVIKFNTFGDSASAVVLGGNPYKVSVSAHHYGEGSCDCYLGQRGILCKHIVALAVHVVMRGGPLTEEDKKLINGHLCSEQLGELSKEELLKTKKLITAAMRYIKPYGGPSRIWFSYQNSLLEGCCRLSKIVSELPVSKQTAKLLVDMLLRLDRKLQRGIDDSDGTVGNFMYQTVQALQEYAKIDSSCIESFEKLCYQSTCFEWSESLVRIFDEGFTEKEN